jgi:hypothetical protein
MALVAGRFHSATNIVSGILIRGHTKPRLPLANAYLAMLSAFYLPRVPANMPQFAWNRTLRDSIVFGI